jgi:hypothetical protein
MKVVDIAKSYIGQFEILGNHGFKDPAFAAKMKAVGHDDGEAWCCLFSELCFKEAYSEHTTFLDKIFSDGCVKTLDNCIKAGIEISTIPVLGSLMIMQQYIDNVKQWQGHAGIPVQILSNSAWVSVEGNTNSKGSREGDSVQPKTRDLMYKPTGLRVAGFALIHEFLMKK